MARSFTRRDFLSGSLGVGAEGALHATLGPAATLVRSDAAVKPTETATTAPSGATATVSRVKRTLVLCTLYGGNDGLNTVIPYESSAYRSLRGGLAIPRDQVQPIGSVDGVALGIHPSLVGLKSLWDAGKVAIILGVGYPNPSFSHFQSMEIMQSADPTGNSTTGWIGRWLDVAGSNPTRALSIGPNLPQVFTGAREQASTLADSTDPGSQEPGYGPNFTSAYTELEHVLRGEQRLEAEVARAGTNLLLVGAKASAALSHETLPPPVNQNWSGDIGNQLDIIAELIKADMPTQAYGAMFGSFDTHSGQLGFQGTLLSQLDAAVQNFMGAFPTVSGRLSPVIVLYSEFGRRPLSNASQGTDHGSANNVIVVGPSVKGGFYGELPSLTRLDDTDNLVHTVDFRRVYATLLAEIMGVDPKGFVGAKYPPLSFLP